MSFTLTDLRLLTFLEETVGILPVLDDAGDSFGLRDGVSCLLVQDMKSSLDVVESLELLCDRIAELLVFLSTGFGAVRGTAFSLFTFSTLCWDSVVLQESSSDVDEPLLLQFSLDSRLTKGFLIGKLSKILSL